MFLNSYPLHRMLRPIPESIPRQKTCLYILLICATALLIYFYSYPLKLENWSYNMLVKPPDTGSSPFERADKSVIYEYDLATKDFNYRSDSLLLQKLFSNLSGSVPTNEPLRTTKIIPDKGSLPATKSDVRSVTLNATSTTAAEVRSTETSATTAGDEKVASDAESDSAKVNKVTGTQATEIERFLNTTIEIETSTREKLSSTTTDHEKRTTVGSMELSTIEYHGSILNASFDNGSSPTYGRHSSSTSNDIEDFKTVKTEMGETTQPTVGSTSRTILNESSVKQDGKFNSTGINETLVTSPGAQNGFLVFSQHCRIPDIDPMHPSIRHLVQKIPPLDCTEDYTPLSRTEGHVLILDEGAILEETKGHNYTCCYKSVTRENDGLTDDDVGFSEECITVSKETIIEDEFITVECKHHNDTLFYKEFHSFIFDKPKVEKRCGKPSESQYSVLIIGVDAMSRMNMHRQLNETAGYMLREMDAVEMYGFNKVGDNTFPNLIPLLVGYDERELSPVCWKSPDLPLDRCNFLWKRFAKKGYRTLYAEDSPHLASFNYVKQGFLHQPTDYYFRHFILAYEDALGRDKPLNCYLCVGSTSETEAILHWTEQFASHFSKRPYFAFSWINSLTHDFLNMGSAGDQMYETFFRNLHRSGALNKTIVILMGDHGMRWGEIRNTYIGRLEERLPMLLIALPEEFKRKYPKFARVLKENSRRLVTPFDLHATLDHLLNLTEDWKLVNTDEVDDELSYNFTSRALSLFQPIPNDRSCDDAFIEEHWCTCESSLEADIKSDEVKQVATFLLDTVNNLLKPESNKCAFLTLDSVSDARLWQPPTEHKGHSVDDNIYTVVIHTNPSKATFEGTVKLSERKSERKLLGTISRLNLYGNQSSCIDNAILKKYCYCL